MIYIVSTRVEQRLAEDQFCNYLDLLPDRLQLPIRKFHRWQDAHASLFGKLLLMKGLNKYWRYNTILESLRYTEFGRPFFPDLSVDFNISHSGGWVVCCISSEAKVGIDIEEIKEVDITDFTDQFLTTEMMRIMNAENRPHEFYSYWTKKEAVCKAEGVGLSAFKEITLNEDLQCAELLGKTWYLKEIFLNKGYCSHLATSVRHDQLEIITEHVAFDVAGHGALLGREM